MFLFSPRVTAKHAVDGEHDPKAFHSVASDLKNAIKPHFESADSTAMVFVYFHIS